MKLHTFDSKLFVTHSHDFTILGPCRDLKAVRQRCALDCKRVVSNDRIGAGQVFENANARVRDGRGFAVHDFLRANDVAAKGCTYALMAEAYTQYWQLASEML